MSEATLEQTRPLSEITRLRRSNKKLEEAEEEVEEEDLKPKQTIRFGIRPPLQSLILDP